MCRTAIKEICAVQTTNGFGFCLTQPKMEHSSELDWNVRTEWYTLKKWIRQVIQSENRAKAK